MNEELKHAFVHYLETNISDVSYEWLAEMAVIHASKQEPAHQKIFFEKTKDKFIKELQFLKDETTYKIIWSLFKIGQLHAHPQDLTWQSIKDVIIHRSSTMKPKYLTEILVLATKDQKESTSDFFEKIEPNLTAKLKEMAIEDLINLLWSSLQIKKGTHFFYEKLEEELSRRIRGVRDDQFETLISCFAGDNYNNEFSDKFMKLIVAVLRDKREKFAISTIVNVIWQFSKIDFDLDNYNTLEVLKEFACYDRLIANLPMIN